MHKFQKHNQNQIYKFCILIMSIILLTVSGLGYKLDKEKSDKLHLEAEQYNEKLIAYKEELRLKELDDSFYQKLRDGFDVNILVIGDSIGAGAGADENGSTWFKQLERYLEKNYNINVCLTNISMGGNSSYAGYVRTKALEDNLNYDLAIICYGQNDGTNNFSMYYESIIRAIQSKYEKCSIISILESSQRDYTDKMVEIQNICSVYNIPVADTIERFNSSEKTYNELASDGVHPNNEGQKIYFEEIKEIIDERVKNNIGFDDRNINPINNGVTSFDEFKFYSSKDFTKEDDKTYSINIESITGIMGIDYSYLSGNNKALIFIDDNLIVAPTVTFNYDFSQRHIQIVSNECTVNNEIKIVFENEEQANGFYGIAFSWN